MAGRGIAGSPARSRLEGVLRQEAEHPPERFDGALHVVGVPGSLQLLVLGAGDARAEAAALLDGDEPVGAAVLDQGGRADLAEAAANVEGPAGAEVGDGP